MSRAGARGVGIGRTQAGTPPTDKQVWLIEKLSSELGLKPPARLATKEDASAYIDQLQAQRPRKARAPVARGTRTAKSAGARRKVSVLNPKTQRYELVSAEEAARRRH